MEELPVKDRIARYRQTALKAVQYQIRHQLPDGGYIWDGYAKDAYHKQAYSWSMSGYFPEAHRLLNWVKANTLASNGELKDYNGDTYKHAWFLQGAHRLGRFDLSMPVMSYLAGSQKRCGGWIELHKDEFVLSRSTAWPGVAAIYAGRMDVAEKAAQCCISFIEQQVAKDRFYFTMTQDGKLVTTNNETCINVDKQKQWYWEVALPMMLMLRMYQATAEKRYLDYAEHFLCTRFPRYLTCSNYGEDDEEHFDVDGSSCRNGCGPGDG